MQNDDVVSNSSGLNMDGEGPVAQFLTGAAAEEALNRVKESPLHKILGHSNDCTGKFR